MSPPLPNLEAIPLSKCARNGTLPTVRRYVQFRDISISDGSLDRRARQFQYLNAFVGKVLETAKSDSGRLLELYSVAQDYAYTNLGVD